MNHRFAFAVALSIAAASAPAADPDVRSSSVGSDQFVFGCPVRIDQPVAGDLIAAGCSVDVNAPVAGDAVAAGGNLRIAAAVGHSVFAAGGRLVIDAAVARNLRVAGGQVELAPKGSIAGNVSVAGGQVHLRGAVKGAVSVSGGSVTIDAPVDGDVQVNAGRLRLGPNARIGGQLRYRSSEALERDPAAQVAGGIDAVLLPSRAASAPGAQRERDGWRARAGWGAGSWVWTVGVMVLAAVLVAALPLQSRRVGEAGHTRLGWSLLSGFIALVCIPAAALLLLVSVIGIPLALLALLLWGALLLVGYAAAGIALGQWALARWRGDAMEQKRWRIGAAVAAVLLLALLGRVPWLGGFIALLAVTAGVGAIVQWLIGRSGPEHSL